MPPWTGKLAVERTRFESGRLLYLKGTATAYLPSAHSRHWFKVSINSVQWDWPGHRISIIVNYRSRWRTFRTSIWPLWFTLHIRFSSCWFHKLTTKLNDVFLRNPVHWLNSAVFQEVVIYSRRAGSAIFLNAPKCRRHCEFYIPQSYVRDYVSRVTPLQL